ncbi:MULTISPECIES: hypothetical protein [Methylococcus]|uniref:hypothetical protein n=1 Tax=Methylococcus TaxID=413 RepID=UPI001C52F6A8|nr:hypothetical protein [Methylococcus capsulatus]QXP92291.1 hypothetical protein KW114_12710 [Methylococcus capsulatus]
MAMKKRNDRIREAVHETARDLHRLGFIEKRKMRKYDALCLAAKRARKSSPDSSRPRVLA